MIQALTLLSSLLISEARPTRRDITSIPGFDYVNDKVRGVNVGGWLVLEPYMNPSMFTHSWDDNVVPVDEYHWTKKLGKEAAQQILNQHWATWITEADFEAMASYGLNFARIPIGYWAVLPRDEDPYVQGQLPFFDQALEWARKHNIKVWVDLHGVPGSQNGFDNSGLRDSFTWQEDSNMQDTYKALSALVERYGGANYLDVVAGIELVNEPLGPVLDMDKLHDYYNKGYEIVRQNNAEQGVIVHDAFEPLGTMDSWLNTPDYYNVVLDHHRYQVFSLPELQRSIDDHIKFACSIGPDMKSIDNKWHLVGEWSAALTDCAPLLNGVYKGSRYDGSFDGQQAVGSCSGIGNIAEWSDEHKVNTRKYVEAQLDSYEYGSAGWIFWAWKTESAIEWDFQKLVDFGLFPNPVTERQYPNICGYTN